MAKGFLTDKQERQMRKLVSESLRTTAPYAIRFRTGYFLGFRIGGKPYFTSDYGLAKRFDTRDAAEKTVNQIDRLGYETSEMLITEIKPAPPSAWAEK